MSIMRNTLPDLATSGPGDLGRDAEDAVSDSLAHAGRVAATGAEALGDAEVRGQDPQRGGVLVEVEQDRLAGVGLALAEVLTSRPRVLAGQGDGDGAENEGHGNLFLSRGSGALPSC